MSYMKTMDGNMAAAHIAYSFSDFAVVYPITPSSPMANDIDEWSAAGRKNLWEQPVSVIEMQSEAGVAGTVHGILKTGKLATSCTSSQGLLLMLPNMYKIAGELLPAVFHVAARAVATSALSIFGDQSDVMGVRSSGFAMLAESSVQEAMDLSAVAHLAAIEASIPFLNFFDGMRTSHELQKIKVIEEKDLKTLINKGKLADFRERAMNPDHPKVSGSNQNPDIYFQQREIINSYYNDLPGVVQKYMHRINALQGTNYDLIDYYGAPDAQEVIVSMGSAAGTIKQTVDYLNAQGRKTGFLNVHLYRPFPKENFLSKLPETVRAIAVLDRTKETGDSGEPLFLDVRNVLFGRDLKVIGGRYGIGGKDTRPEHILAVFDELKKPDSKSESFTIGIEDDVTHLSLKTTAALDLTPAGTYQIKVWGYASDGSIGASHSTIKIIGDNTDNFVQGFSEYDSKKTGGLTISHMRFGKKPILSEYATISCDFVECANPAYLQRYDLVKGLKDGGIFLLNCSWTVTELAHHLPDKLKKYLAAHTIKLYTIDAAKIARELGLGVHINTVMKAAMFKLINVMPLDRACEMLKKESEKYAKHSETMVEQNIQAMDDAVNAIHQVEVPFNWLQLNEKAETVQTRSEAVPHKKWTFNFLDKVESAAGDQLSVQELINCGMTSGDLLPGTAVQVKKRTAFEVPEWNPEFCVKCHRCSFVCPHAAIRPFLLDEDEWNVAPAGFKVLDYKGENGLKYRIQVSVDDCTGCGLCVEACPKKGKALKMLPYESQKNEARNWAFAMTLKQKENPAHGQTVAATQFNQPLFEFSSACAGCGETPYIKLLTQMFGDRMMIANATGCSSIYGGNQAVPYTTNSDGQGPAWSNSLFEDNAEFGYGMWLASVKRRQEFAADLRAAMPDMSSELRSLSEDWLLHIDDSDRTRERSEKLKLVLAAEHYNSEKLAEIWEKRDQLVKPSQWIIGGDGWAYDIGFGGLDHVIASGADVNILVMDNEVYANTGGQLSKATPASAVAQFAKAGKVSAKKDLGFMEITYGNVYVAQIASGANMMQTIRAFDEAEKHKGPSLIIAYTPCISHGLCCGMSQVLDEAKEAVESGYWQLYRYNPELEEKGRTPLLLDFKQPDFSKIHGFLMKQSRFSNLRKVDARRAEALYDKAAHDARAKFLRYARISGDAEKFLANEKEKEQKSVQS